MKIVPLPPYGPISKVRHRGGGIDRLLIRRHTLRLTPCVGDGRLSSAHHKRLYAIEPASRRRSPDGKTTGESKRRPESPKKRNKRLVKRVARLIGNPPSTLFPTLFTHFFIFSFIPQVSLSLSVNEMKVAPQLCAHNIERERDRETRQEVDIQSRPWLPPISTSAATGKTEHERQEEGSKVTRADGIFVPCPFLHIEYRPIKSDYSKY